VNLALEILNRGMSRRAFARAAGVSEESVRRLEDGRRVHPATAKRVADYLQVPVTDVMPLDVAQSR